MLRPCPGYLSFIFSIISLVTGRMFMSIIDCKSRIAESLNPALNQPWTALLFIASTLAETPIYLYFGLISFASKNNSTIRPDVIPGASAKGRPFNPSKEVTPLFFVVKMWIGVTYPPHKERNSGIALPLKSMIPLYAAYAAAELPGAIKTDFVTIQHNVLSHP